MVERSLAGLTHLLILSSLSSCPAFIELTDVKLSLCFVLVPFALAEVLRCRATSFNPIRYAILQTLP